MDCCRREWRLAESDSGPRLRGDTHARDHRTELSPIVRRYQPTELHPHRLSGGDDPWRPLARRSPGAPRSRRRPARVPGAAASPLFSFWQHGGPSQLDTFDMKPEAPSEYRGPYRPIPSNVDGIQVSELLPYHAKIMDKATVFRGFTHGNGDHWAAAHWLLTGYLGATGSDRKARNPSMGAIASHLLGPKQRGVPATVNINDGGFGYHGAAHLGVAHNPLRTGEFSYGNEAGRLPTGRCPHVQARRSAERQAAA